MDETYRAYQTAAVALDGDTNDKLTWANVGLASLLLFVTTGVSLAMNLRLEKQVLVASVRCVVQLTVLGFVLKQIFSTDVKFYVYLMSSMLGLLAALEISRWRTKRWVRGMLWISFVPVFGSSMAVGMFGGKYAMNFDPPYIASKFIPILGMLLGNTMVGIALGIDNVLGSLDTRRDVSEVMLCYGATRWEVVQPIVTEASRLALIPTITMVSITGLISIPGMMSGQILGGADVVQAAHYQQVIMFMIAASTALGVMVSTIAVAFVVVDKTPRVHPDRIEQQTKDSQIHHSVSGIFGSSKPRCGDTVRKFRERFLQIP